MGGVPVIAGTRIPIVRIIFLLKEGYTVDAIHEEYNWAELKKIEGAISELVTLFSDQEHVAEISKV